jgi:hypothetical protein
MIDLNIFGVSSSTNFLRRFRCWNLIRVLVSSGVAITGGLLKNLPLGLVGLGIFVLASIVMASIRCPACRRRVGPSYVSFFGSEWKMFTGKLPKKCPACSFDWLNQERPTKNFEIDEATQSDRDKPEPCLQCGELIPRNCEQCQHCGWSWNSKTAT